MKQTAGYLAGHRTQLLPWQRGDRPAWCEGRWRGRRFLWLAEPAALPASALGAGHSLQRGAGNVLSAAPVVVLALIWHAPHLIL